MTPAPCVLWLGSHQNVPSTFTGTFTGGPSRGLAFLVTVMFAYCLSLPSATPHEGDSLAPSLLRAVPGLKVLHLSNPLVPWMLGQPSCTP